MKDLGIQKVSQNLLTRLGTHYGEKKKTGSFEKILKDSLSEVNNLQLKADQAIEQLASGNRENIHETMIAIETANISFQLMMQMRNKILEAYREVMRTQI